MPSQLAFFSAEGAPGQSSASVHTWFLDNASPHSLS
jgi:hypothetical protein